MFAFLLDMTVKRFLMEKINVLKMFSLCCISCFIPCVYKRRERLFVTLFFLAKRLKEIYLYTILTFIVKNCFVFTVLFLLSTKKGPGRLVIVNWHATLWSLLRGHPR